MSHTISNALGDRFGAYDLPSDFHELEHVDAVARIREWHAEGVTEYDLVAATDWSIAGVRRAIAGVSSR